MGACYPERMRRLAFALLFVAGCGGTAVEAREPDGEACELARLEAQRTWQALARDGEGIAPPEPGPPIALEAVLRDLREHEQSLRAAPDEVDGQVAFALADAMMGGIDEVASDVSESLRSRADDAAEALLTDRSAQGAARATADAIAVIEQVVAEARPDRAAAATSAWSTAEVIRRASATAEAYGEGPEEGDRAAQRAEEAPPVAGLESAQADAADASTAVRETCGFRRALTVPSL